MVDTAVRKFRNGIGFAFALTIVATQFAICRRACADDKLPAEAVDFAGAITFLSAKVPGFLLVAVRNGEMAFAGFGTVADKGGKTPDADTKFRIASISKVFCGEVLASMVL